MKHWAPSYRALVALLVGLWCGTAWAGQPPGIQPGGDVSTTTVKVPASTISRSQESIDADRFNALSYPNVFSTGSADSAPGLQAVQTQAQNAGTGLIVLPSGNYLLGGNVYSVPGITWQLENANVHGSALVGCTDGAAIAGNAGMAWCRIAAGAGFEATVHASALVQGQTNTTSTEKAAVYARVQNNDPSSYSGTAYSHDGVAYEGQAIMGSTTGRIWSYDSLVSVPAGADGQATGYETDIYNNGVPGVLDQPNAKLGYDAVCSGPNQCTIGILITNNYAAAPSGQWQDGLVVRTSAIASGGDAFGLRSTGANTNDIAAIHADGSALFTAETVAGHVFNTGIAPTAISCGTAPVVTANSTDRRGSVTIGTGNPTGCTVNWHAAYAAAPFCTVSTSAPAIAVGSNPATGGIFMPASAAMSAGLVLTWICEG